jgi:hypothetical protein
MNEHKPLFRVWDVSCNGCDAGITPTEDNKIYCKHCDKYVLINFITMIPNEDGKTLTGIYIPSKE